MTPTPSPTPQDGPTAEIDIPDRVIWNLAKAFGVETRVSTAQLTRVIENLQCLVAAHVATLRRENELLTVQRDNAQNGLNNAIEAQQVHDLKLGRDIDTIRTERDAARVENDRLVKELKLRKGWG